MCMVFESIVAFAQICELESDESSVVFRGVKFAFAARFVLLFVAGDCAVFVQYMYVSCGVKFMGRVYEYLFVLSFSSFSN